MPTKKRAKRICFFITPIGNEGSEQRRQADQVQRHILNEILHPKFKIVRADELPQPGSITHQIIELLYNADLVVADLTGSNANVAYELAVRHAFNKVSIHLIDKRDTIPFDLKDERTISYDLKDPDLIEACKEELKKVVRAISGGRVPYNSPVFRTLSIAAATAEERAEFLEKMADQIDTIAIDVSSLESTINLSGIDQIDSIKESLETIEKQYDGVLHNLDQNKQLLKKIAEKLEK